MTDEIRLSAAVNRFRVPLLDVPQLIFVLAELKPTAMKSSERLPINFCLVLDRSGSMMGEKLRTMKEAVKSVIDQLTPVDFISIVTFESRTEILVSSQLVGDKKSLKQVVEKIQDGGGTNLASALNASIRLIAESNRQNEVRRIILLTDGEATDRQQDSFNLADEAGELGIPILCLGFGEEWNVDFLFEIADRSIRALPGSHTGMADYIPTPNDAVMIFQDAYQSMKIVAQDAFIKLNLASGIEARRIWQVAPNIQDLGKGIIGGRSVQMSIDQLEQSGAAFLVEVLIPPRIAGVVRIAQIDAAYQLPGKEMSHLVEDLVLEYSGDSAVENKLNERVMHFVEKVQAYKLQMQALQDADIGDLGSATLKLRQAATILLSQGDDQLANQIAQEADQLEHSGEISNKGRKTILLTSRKTVRLSD